MTSNAYKLLAQIIVIAVFLISCSNTPSSHESFSSWETIEATGTPTARHEAAFVAYKDKLYLIGGRRINSVDVYDPATKTWAQKSKTPLELHHFQAVAIDDAIYLIGAMTGGWPNEKPLDKVMVYYPEEDRFEETHDIPEGRRRGGAGIAVYNGKIYMIGGITNGHMNGYQNWFDEYDPKTGAWRVLPDAPHKRDHFAASVIGHKLYAFAGRKTEHAIGNDFGPTQTYGDVFNFETSQWDATSQESALPTTRAGNMVLAWGDELVIGGGESENQIPAHNEVEAYNTVSRSWREWPSLKQGRHGSAFAIIGDYVYTASGCGNRGGEPELTSIERLKLPEKIQKTTSSNPVPPSILTSAGEQQDSQSQLWHTVTLNFEGPKISETSATNPFTDYRLFVEFTSGETRHLIRGFYAADGNAAHSSASEGNIWQVRFTPDQIGDWSYKARLDKGTNIAISRDLNIGETYDLKNNEGTFTVAVSDKIAPDFRAANRGQLISKNGYFQFKTSQKFWLKGGPNSPENLLAYSGFDATYRLKKEAREGEAAAIGGIHNFEPHLKDWNMGDPEWAEGKGRSIIGAMNYISEMGMNTSYFLTLNINGDGNDVWPYENPKDFTRFDVSKLEQWNILFNHMQAKGILLHIVTQETENELMLDGGDTGPLRRLYFNELIARFGHHPALIWNLGEENGPVSWRPEGQNDAQRKAMISYLKAHDPYQHPILLHTHSKPDEKDHIAGPLLGFKPMDGLSFQVDHRENVYTETQKWRKLSKEAGHDWLITMDEIGPWHMGAAADQNNPTHNMLRRHVLWGHLLGGGAGVEWYFGAYNDSNDLTTEDWRTRNALWKQTRHALDFFEDHLPFWDMAPCPNLMDRKDVYCATKRGEAYAFYMPEGGTGFLGLPTDKSYTISWFNPIEGGPLQDGTLKTVDGSNRLNVGLPPTSNGQDWVLLLKAVK